MLHEVKSANDDADLGEGGDKTSLRRAELELKLRRQEDYLDRWSRELLRTDLSPLGRKNLQDVMFNNRQLITYYRTKIAEIPAS